MSFATGLALLVGLLVVVPAVAHLLRRGKTEEQVFPPAALVPTVVVTSEQRSRLEDLLLLALRALMILALAVLGATPFVQCSRLSVDRQSGASVALAIIIDDSQSMRAVGSDGATRFDAARTGAEQLLASARQGDAVALVLAGHPARLTLSATTDLNTARRALEQLSVSDRSTDLNDAVALARSALRELPHVDKRVVLLSDLEAGELSAGEPEVWAPLKRLAEPVKNCGIALAERQGRNIAVTAACNDAAAAKGRELQLLVSGEEDATPLQTIPLQMRKGQQRLNLKQVSFDFDLVTRITGEDAIAYDNLAQVSKETSRLAVGVVVDATKASTVTGGATVIEQGLNALNPDLDVRPMGSLPQSAEDLRAFAALVVDDPPGLSPETRAALLEWIERGGVVLGLLGPSVAATQLAASLEPFARQGATWDESVSVGVDAASTAWLGEEAASLATVSPRGRVRLDATDLPGTTIAGSWTDGAPFLFRRPVGRGLVLTVGLPASVDQSDFSLRPGFLTLLDFCLGEARKRTGPKRTVAGTPWLFPADGSLTVTGPQGKLKVSNTSAQGAPQKRVVADVTGRYEVESGGTTEYRFAVLNPEELARDRVSVSEPTTSASGDTDVSRVDASPEWALLILALFALELFFRVLGEPLKARLKRSYS